MEKLNIYIRFSNLNKKPIKLATLAKEKQLTYGNEGGGLRGHLITEVKFLVLTVASPWITAARLVRSAVFLCTKGERNRAIYEFLGALATPLVATACLSGTLLSAVVYVITGGQISFYNQMRRTEAHFQAWINRIDLQDPNLPSYSQRVSDPLSFWGETTDSYKNIWTTTPCMQPVLEKGVSRKGGLLDVERMQRIFPHIKINGVAMEGDKVVIQSEYVDEDTHEVTCHGACERKRISKKFCCCFRVETLYRRFLCCELQKGTCHSISNPGDSCGFTSCGACGMGVCVCHQRVDEKLVSTSAGCFGPGGTCATTC